jgi:hypothetical protein
VRSYRRGGVPIVHLWESNHALVALGVSKHGVALIYRTQRLPH